jgi:hypothetical protein
VHRCYKSTADTNKDSKEAAEESIEQSIANDGGSESIEVTGEGEAKGTAAAGTGL